MIELLIAEPFINLLDGQKIENAAVSALNHEHAKPNQDLTIAIDDDSRLHALNKEFLGIDAPTDVLSFPSGEEWIDPETEHTYLGDIAISYPRAAEQAAAAGHPVINELQLLVVHGVLHLLGYDHAESVEKVAMWAAQKDILDGLGVNIVRLPE